MLLVAKVIKTLVPKVCITNQINILLQINTEWASKYVIQRRNQVGK